ncbi:hypothetical protein B723_18190 [Pseudomonas fluorescens NCIMB 11764]|uniref:Uncharacterized protein n=1 Tax=Pseudomonas fluorescens NCIMB 11764 TaxID=1221522 RepID=A0A0K1QRF6_PSEFL|nr:hypothetical protein B723_18190 [Pseudomonas fluorescens NCIMB 11764]
MAGVLEVVCFIKIGVNKMLSNNLEFQGRSGEFFARRRVAGSKWMTDCIEIVITDRFEQCAQLSRFHFKSLVY